jgi:mono/diheme cytochrome c family protein
MKIPSSIALIGSLVLAGGALVGLGFVPGVSWKVLPAPNWKNLAANDWQHVFPTEKHIPLAAAPASVGAALPEAVTFNTHIQPILSENCYHCHGPDSGSRKADLRLDRAEFAFKPLQSGQPAIIKGHAVTSEVVRRLRHKDPKEVMPPPATHKLISEREIALIEKWIEQGANYQEHWSLIPPLRPSVPTLPDTTWPKNPIDNFILASLRKVALTPAPEAGKAVLLRRVTLDLTGLPPTPEDVDAFLADTRPDAYEQAVDRLLGSAAYGEHQTRYWLDAARYADTHGIHIDNYRSIWPYRDWVIKAFNANQPFDQFTIEQLAGDLLPNPTLEQKIATGFHRCLPTTGEGGAIADEYLATYAKDRVETTSAVWLGLTTGCATCHDHKFDPISQKDFYQLSAFFRNNPMSALDGNSADHPPNLQLPAPEDAPRLQELTHLLPAKQEALKEAEKLEDNAAPADALRRELAALQAERDAIHKRGAITLVMQENNEEPSAYILNRGDYTQKKDKVGADVPAVFGVRIAKDDPKNRLGLARWLVHPDHPLTARVTVNRFWQQVFGTGLVASAGDFGIMGERPVHPALLDWLAVEFRESGWNVKQLMKLLVTSASYRQSGVTTPAKLEQDPANRLLAHGPRQRLDGEMIRDQALFVSGLLVSKLGGPSVKPYQPDGVWESVAMKESNTSKYARDSGEALYRRSLYTFWKRSAPHPSLEAFGTPSRENCTVRRERTNTPLQALVTLNDIQFVEAARVLAERVLKQKPSDAERLDCLYRLVLARSPQPAELPVLNAALTDFRATFGYSADAAKKLITYGERPPDPALAVPELAAWTLIASQTLNLDEALNR